MEAYKERLNFFAHQLKNSPTLPESLLWSRIKNRQILGMQFYKQQVIENFIVDFYAPGMKLVIEVDGAQHFEDIALWKDKQRDKCLRNLGLVVKRYTNREILCSLEDVLEDIWRLVEDYQKKSN